MDNYVGLTIVSPPHQHNYYKLTTTTKLPNAKRSNWLAAEWLLQYFGKTLNKIGIFLATHLYANPMLRRGGLLPVDIRKQQWITRKKQAV